MEFWRPCPTSPISKKYQRAEDIRLTLIRTRAKRHRELMRYFVHGVVTIGDCAHVQLPHFHLCNQSVKHQFHKPVQTQRRTILGERACLITEQILYPSELLRQCARSDNRIGYLIVSHDLLRVDGLAHIQVDAQTEEGFIRGTSSYEKSTYLMGIMDENRMRKRRI